MSSFMMKAKHKETGEVADVFALDNCFGKHEYGYVIGDTAIADALREKEFYASWERYE